MDQIALWTLVVAALTLLATVAVWWFPPRSRVRIRIVWDSPYATVPNNPMPYGEGIPVIKVSVFNDGASPARSLEFRASNMKAYEGSVDYPLDTLDYLPPGPEPWDVLVPRWPWYWDQPHKGIHLTLHPDGQELAQIVEARVKWRKYPDRGRWHTVKKRSPQPLD